MLIDNFDCERTVIKQYLKLQLQKCLQQPQAASLSRLPHQVYTYCHEIFRKQRSVNTYLLQLFEQVFFLRNVNKLKEEAEDELASLYRRILAKGASDKDVFLSQIILRFLLLGLSVKLNKKDYQLWKVKLKDYVSRLQLEIQLVLDGKQSLSDMLIKELELLRQNFDCLPFYEEIRTVFDKYEVMNVVKWAQKIIQDKKKKIKEEILATIPFELEGGKKTTDHRERTQKRIRYGQNIQTKTTQKQQKKQPDSSRSLMPQNTSKSKEKRQSLEKPNKNGLSCISLANKIRLSGPGPTTRFSSKYTFKSTKKTMTQPIVQYTEYSPTKSPGTENPQISQSTQLQPLKQSPVPHNNDEDSNVLCAATPPKAHRKQFE